MIVQSFGGAWYTGTMETTLILLAVVPQALMILVRIYVNA